MNLKLVSIFLLASLCAFGQALTPITDAPQHVFAVGYGVSTPTPLQQSPFFAYGEKISGATYSFTRADFSLSRNGTFNSILTTGIKELIYQSGRFTVAIDGTIGAAVGATSTSNGSATAAFAYGTSGDLFVRLSKTANLTPGASNNYMVLGVGALGTTAGTGLDIRVGFVHSIN